MKIAFIGQKGIPMKFGGVEKHVERLAFGLAERGHYVYVYTRAWYTSPKLKNYKGVHLISIKSVKTKHLDAISHTLLSTIDALKRNVDIIHYHGVGPALLAWIPRLFRPNIKVIITFHSIDRFHQKWGLIARLILKIGEWAAVHFAHETIAVSKVLQLYCAKQYNVKTVYVPNGVDAAKSVKAKVISKQFGLKKSGYILFLSRLVKHKGAHYLIEAYKNIKTDKKLVIGGGSSFTDDYLKYLKKLAGSNPNIIFTGNIEGGSRAWKELFSNAYLFVHPSDYEGLPIAILEAMSFGLPVLASDIPENMEIIAGRYGFSFFKKNQNDLRRKLQYLLAKPELIKKVGDSARDYVVQNYKWEDVVNSVEIIYKKVLHVPYPEKKIMSAKFGLVNLR